MFDVVASSVDVPMSTVEIFVMSLDVADARWDDVDGLSPPPLVRLISIDDVVAGLEGVVGRLTIDAISIEVISSTEVILFLFCF